MKKVELEEKIEELEEEIERLEDEIRLIDKHKELDKAQKEAVYMTKGFIKAFMDEGFMKDEAIELTKMIFAAAGLRS